VREIVALGVGLLLIVVLLFKKVQIGTTMLVVSAVIGLLAGLGPQRSIEILFLSTIERATVELVVVVTLICILSYLLQQYGVLNKMADSLEELINNNKLLIMFLPMLMGVLYIPGGAVMSAPVVDSMGDKLRLNNVRKSAANMVFRHSLFLIFPFSATVILASQLSGLNSYTVIKYNIPVALVTTIAGYMLYIRDSVTDTETAQGKPYRKMGDRISAAFINTSPLWSAILLNLAFGVPFYLALIPGIFIVYFLAEKRENFLKDIALGINWRMLYSIIGIMVLQGFIKRMPAVAQLINTSLESGIDIKMLVFLTSCAVGLLTANNNAVVGMILPIFLPLITDINTKGVLVSLTLAAGFIGYHFSPLHLCQIFTVEYFNIKVNELYREYRLFGAIVVLSTIILYAFVY
jgi:integral membrane protein (TIGR00529 family)